MRVWIAKFFALALVGAVVFGTLTTPQAKAQTADQIQQAVNDAASGANINAVSQLLGQYPTAGIAIADVLAGKMQAADTNATASANLAAALVATGNASLIAGVLVANGMTSGSQSAIAAALGRSGNSTLIASVEAQLPANSTVLALVANAALANGLVVVQELGTIGVVVQPSPAQTCSGASCS